MKNIQIVAGIPSLNEEKTIRYVTESIDEGLIRYFPDYNSIIVNVDQSSDNTKNAFMNAQTHSPKKYIHTGYPPGKGRNLLALLKYALSSNDVSKKVKYIFTIDSDVRSIRPDWVNKLLSPLITNEADYVTPLYVRNRYEANTTNHFCFPIISAIFNSEIRQPIAGEYAMNRNFAEYLLLQNRNPEVNGYGIDPFFTIHAVGGKFRTTEVYLGRKIHNPSFGKIIPMFQQIAATTFYVISQYKNNILQNFKNAKTESYRESFLKARIGVGGYIKRPSKEVISERKKYINQQLKSFLSKQDGYFLPLDRKVIHNSYEKQYLDAGSWVEILCEFLQYVINNNITPSEATRLSTIISPLYLIRVLSYYEEIENLKPEEIERVIINQKDLLKSRLKKSLTN